MQSTDNTSETQTEHSPYTTPQSNLVDESKQSPQSPEIFSLDKRIGRIRFLAYNTGFLLTFYLIILLAGRTLVVNHSDDSYLDSTMSISLLGYIGIFLGSVYLFYCFIFARRRLHDLGRSGWMSLIYLIPVINVIFGLYVMLAPGNESSNRYGPIPANNTTGVYILGLGLPVLFIGFAIYASIMAF